jgi:hypothetical protein
MFGGRAAIIDLPIFCTFIKFVRDGYRQVN